VSVCVSELDQCADTLSCGANQTCHRLSFGVYVCRCQHGYVNQSGVCVGQLKTAHDTKHPPIY